MPPKAVKSKTELGRRLRRARGDVPLDRVSVKVQDRIGIERGYGRETIRRYEAGDISEDTADLVLLSVLAELYGVTLQWLSPTVARRAMQARELFSDAVLGCKE